MVMMYKRTGTTVQKERIAFYCIIGWSWSNDTSRTNEIEIGKEGLQQELPSSSPGM
jgi:hypothetical protein